MMLLIAELKKLLALFRADPKSIGAGILPPTVILIAFFFTIGSFSPIDIAIFNDDQGPLGARLEQCILSERSPLGDRPYFQAVQTDRTAAQERFAEDRLYAYLEIPADFSATLADGGTPELVFHLNNYSTDIAKNLRLYLDEGILAFYEATDPGLRVTVLEESNVPTLVSWFELVGSGVFLLSFLLGVVAAVLYLLSMERRNGTLMTYQLAPVRLLPSLAARTLVALLSGTITATVDGLLLYLLTGRDYLPHLPRMLPALLTIGLIYCFLALVLGLYLESFAGSILVGLLGTCLLWFLSGATFSIQNSTGILCSVGRLIPNTYVLSDLRGALFGMDPSIGSVSYRHGWLVLLAYLAGTAALACFACHRRLVRAHR